MITVSHCHFLCLLCVWVCLFILFGCDNKDIFDDQNKGSVEVNKIICDPPNLFQNVPYDIHAKPESILDLSWIIDRRLNQIDESSSFEVFCGFYFTNIVKQTGIDFKHRVVDDAGRTYKPVHYDHGNGLAVADVDSDGLHDIYFVNQVGSNQLWRNLGHGKFEDITDYSGVAMDDRISVGASFADINNDGFPDLYVTSTRSGNVLFQNDGSGKFNNITNGSGLGYQGHSSGSVFFDYNKDGLLDLFLTNVGQYTTNVKRNVEISDNLKDYESGHYYFYSGLMDAFTGHTKPERTEPNKLFKNVGNSVFMDVTEEVGLIDQTWSGDATILDVDQDGWLDLYVLNMQGNDKYYRNVGGIYFEEDPYVFGKTPWGSMGIKVFDYDNEGSLDVFVTDMHSDMYENLEPDMEKFKSRVKWADSFLMDGGNSIFGNAFYRYSEQGIYEEISDDLLLENYWPWGPSVGDINADGYDDIFVTASMNYPFRYAVNNVFLNEKGITFRNSEFILGVEPRVDWNTATPWFKIDCSGKDSSHQDCIKDKAKDMNTVWGASGSRSSVIFDMDLDGDLDIIISDFNSNPMVLKSNLTDKTEVHYLKIDLIGTDSNRNGVGSIVKVYSEGKVYTKFVDGKSGYLSQSILPLYFGLDRSETVEKIEIFWTSGVKQTLEGPLETNNVIEVIEHRN
jgi:hypothetical protein